MWTRKELKEKAKIRFKATYWKAVLVSLIVMVLAGGSNFGSTISSKFTSNTDFGHGATTESVTNGVTNATATDVVGIIVMVIIAIIIFLIVFAIVFAIMAFLINPIVVGCSRYFVKNLDTDADVKEVLSGFDENYKNTVKVMFFRDLYTMLWSLLFVIPGIIKSYEYRMMPYLLAENPDMPMETAFAMSKQMMTGNKWNAFVLDLSFILWHILSLFTCGILEVFYVAPYINMTNAALYDSLKNHYQQGQVEVNEVEGSAQEM